MFELSQSHFGCVKDFLKEIECDVVYGYSIIENRQKGRIFVDDVNNSKTVLFWHYYGFAFISGLNNNNDFNNMLKLLLLNKYEEKQRRFALLVNDDD